MISMRPRYFLSIVMWTCVLLLSCAHVADQGGCAGFGRNSAEARINHLLIEGGFAEAEALISDSVSSGLVEQSTAVTLRREIADLSMKLGDIPARLQ
ncbi:MAG: hypothetical protein ABW123_05830 [Cystobacter sp.]